MTVTNVGTTTLYITGAEIAGVNSPDFTSNSGNPPCNGSIVAGGTCNFTVYFNPSTTSAESASYLLFDNSTGSPQSLPLTGTGD